MCSLKLTDGLPNLEMCIPNLEKFVLAIALFLDKGMNTNSPRTGRLIATRKIKAITTVLSSLLRDDHRNTCRQMFVTMEEKNKV